MAKIFRLALVCWLMTIPASVFSGPGAGSDRGCGGRPLYARKATENDHGPVNSPDALKWVTATLVEDGSDADGMHIEIVRHLRGKRFPTRLQGFRSEILWSPDAGAFAVNQTEGGGGFDQRA
jgi:hypothetical protein